MLPRLGAPLDQHLQVQLFGRQPLKRVLADSAKPAFIDVFQDLLFQVGVSKLSGIVVPQDTLDLG